MTGLTAEGLDVVGDYGAPAAEDQAVTLTVTAPTEGSGERRGTVRIDCVAGSQYHSVEVATVLYLMP